VTVEEESRISINQSEAFITTTITTAACYHQAELDTEVTVKSW